METQQEQQFGKYQLLERIAIGGMAEIYRARYQAAAGVTKLVVIKKILPHYAGNRSFVSMFINEATIAVGLSHGNIAQVFDFGEIDGEYYLAMEFVNGQPLSKVLRKAQSMNLRVLPPALAAQIVIEICKGLHYAHTRVDERSRPLNIIHRDVSPQNVILSYEGQVKLVDFGIAKARHAGVSAETQSGAVKGKYVYFSPEQARGKELDARTDVFATGIVLYELACGRLPFEGKMMETLGRIVRGEYPRPRVMNPALPAVLEKIITTALANDRNQRYPSAMALQDALAAFVATEAPTFPGSAIASFMGLLFEPELAHEGVPSHVSPEFRELVRSYMQPGPDPDEATLVANPVRLRATAPGVVPDEALLAASRRSGEYPAPEPLTTIPEIPAHLDEPSGSDELTEADTPIAGAATEPGPPPRVSVRTEPAPPPARRESVARTLPAFDLADIMPRPAKRALPKWLFITLPALAMVAAGGLVVSFGVLGSSTVRVTSTPAGASVLIDGHPAASVTPLLVRGLSAGEPHVIEISAQGMKPWTQRVMAARGETVDVDARLEPTDPKATSAGTGQP